MQIDYARAYLVLYEVRLVRGACAAVFHDDMGNGIEVPCPREQAETLAKEFLGERVALTISVSHRPSSGECAEGAY